MTIELEKILTCSAEAYAASKGVELKNYDLVGVRFIGVTSLFSAHTSWFNDFASIVPDTAEVVVDFTPGMMSNDKNGERCFYIGTALVPKQKKRHNPE